MRTQSRTQRLSKLALLSVLLALPIFTGSPFCSKSDDETPSAPPPSRSTEDELLTNWFERVYNGQDSVRYEEMLDDAFQFEFLADDATDLQNRGILPAGTSFWGKTLDLGSTGRMFRSDDVGDISINLTIITESPYTGTDCTGCTDVEATVDLNVTTRLSDPDPLILQVRSKQFFVVKPDPADATLWVIFRQNDSALPPSKQAEAPALP